MASCLKNYDYYHYQVTGQLALTGAQFKTINSFWDGKNKCESSFLGSNELKTFLSTLHTYIYSCALFNEVFCMLVNYLLF